VIHPPVNKKPRGGLSTRLLLSNTGLLDILLPVSFLLLRHIFFGFSIKLLFTVEGTEIIGLPVIF